MAYKFNPLLGIGLDDVGEGGATATPGGSDTQVQYNDDGSLAGSADLTWDDTGKELGIGGDINLDDGGTYSTTLQMVTATANRTISFPDATGTVALVAGSNGQLTYNSSGAQAGLTSASIGSTDEINISLAGAASTPPVSFTGTWFTGGTATTTKPQLLIEPTGTTSTAWSTSGTGLGVNAASGFSGRLLDLQTNGTSRMVVQGDGKLLVGTSTSAGNAKLEVTETRRLSAAPSNSGWLELTDSAAVTSGTLTDIATATLASINSAYFRLEVMAGHTDVTGGYSQAVSIREGLIGNYASTPRIVNNTETRNLSGSVNSSVIATAVSTDVVTGTSGANSTFVFRATVTISGTNSAGRTPRLSYRLSLLSIGSNSVTAVSNI